MFDRDSEPQKTSIPRQVLKPSTFKSTDQRSDHPATDEPVNIRETSLKFANYFVEVYINIHFRISKTYTF